MNLRVSLDEASDVLADAFRAARMDPASVDNHEWGEHVAWLLDMLEDGWEIDDAAKHLAQRVRQEAAGGMWGGEGIPADAPQWPFGGVPGWMRR